MRVLEVGRSIGSSVLERLGRAAGRFQEETGLATDVLESDEEYLVVFDAPGANASDVQVRYQDDAVLVRLDRFREYREGFEMLFPGRGLALDGRAKLPDDAVVEAEEARARLNDDGTLYVFLPKGEGATEVAVERESEAVEREAATIDDATTPATTVGEGVEPDESDEK
jgi:HSP20 family molecular chaperone IbpA